MTTHDDRLLVAAFYKFITLEDYTELQQPLLRCCNESGLSGTILLAAEGINGTIAGSEAGVEAMFEWLRSDPRFKDIGYKRSYVSGEPFYRMKVKLKKEIVTMGQQEVDPVNQTGIHVDPADWNKLISADDVLVLDTRNHYECEIGTFANAVSPETTNFREFPDFVEQKMDPENTPKVAMFCTGGIRCEKASAWLLHKGFKEVYQLDGGILNYLEKIPAEESLWQGECFVFDNRVAVDHELEEGSFIQCYACRRPLSEEDIHSAHYLEGVSCPYCYDSLSETQKRSFSERQKQVKLAEERDVKHIGASMPGTQAK